MGSSIPKDDEVMVKVVATDSNPKDWKVCLILPEPVATDAGSPFLHAASQYYDRINQGDDISGIVEAVGKDVLDVRPGDQVAAFHRMGKPHGSFAEYAIVPASTTFHLPSNISFEEGATLPLASMTAAVALFQHLRLPSPWKPVPQGQTFPVLIYGGASAVGSYA